MHNDVKLLPIEMDLVSQIKPRVEISSKLADASISSTATRKEDSWVKQAAEDLGLDDLSGLEDFEDDIIKKQRKRKKGRCCLKTETKALKYELKTLLANQSRRIPVNLTSQAVSRIWLIKWLLVLITMMSWVTRKSMH